MANPEFDPVGPITTALRNCLCDTLSRRDAPVCRCSRVPAPTPPHDICGCASESGACCNQDGGGEGQAWVAVSRIFPTDNFPGQLVEVNNCCRHTLGVELEIGITRCAHTLTDAGSAPCANDLEEDTDKALRDAAILREVVICCFQQDDDRRCGDVLIGSTTSTVQGGCLATVMTLTVRAKDCACEDPEDEGATP